MLEMRSGNSNNGCIIFEFRCTTWDGRKRKKEVSERSKKESASKTFNFVYREF